MSNQELRSKFTRMSTQSLLSLVSKGGMKTKAATQAAAVLQKRIPNPAN